MNTPKLKLLIIVDPERPDFYSYFNELEPYAELSLLWFIKEKDFVKPKGNIHFTNFYFWDAYATPKDLIKKVQPDKIIFFEVLDQRQISLVIAANAMKVPTIYLEHGAAGHRETALNRSEEGILKNLKENKLKFYKDRLVHNSVDMLKVKRFYYSVLNDVSLASKVKFTRLPVQGLLFNPNKTLRLNKFPERLPKQCILFSKANQNQFELYTGVTDKEAITEGVPMFDKYYRSSPEKKNHVVYIEHPYLEEFMHGWTEEHHRHIAEELRKLWKTRPEKLYIKLHPFSKKARWDAYFDEHDNIEVIQEGDFTDLFLSAKIILSYSSSLLTALLCAKKNCVLLGWHPSPAILGVDYSQYQICHKSLSIDGLKLNFEKYLAENKCIVNDEGYVDFLKYFNYPFDGKAKDRVIAHLLADKNAGENLSVQK